MTAIEVSVNGKKQCVAGIRKDGVVTALLRWVGRGDERRDLPREDVGLNIQGLDSARDQHVEWSNVDLKIGDEVVLRVLDVRKADKPKKRAKSDPVKERRIQEAYVRRLVKDLGWNVSEK